MTNSWCFFSVRYCRPISFLWSPFGIPNWFNAFLSQVVKFASVEWDEVIELVRVPIDATFTEFKKKNDFGILFLHRAAWIQFVYFIF